MSWLDDAIQTGLGRGTLEGFLSQGILISEAAKMLKDGTYRNPATAYERGVAKGLLSNGFIRRKFGFLWLERTDKPIPDGSGSPFEKMVIDMIRDAKDAGLNERGFTAKFAVALYDASNREMPWKEAKNVAFRSLRDFYKSEGIQFGDPEYDWTGQAARELAHELEISYWD